MALVLMLGFTSVAFAQPSVSEPATTATISANDALYDIYPFDDHSDMRRALKGRIAPLPNDGIVKDAGGKVVWDLKQFQDTIAKDAKSPDTVNPSLWRMAQLLMVDGLFEVVEGVYQVRGMDLSNITFVEGETGVTIYDPLISAETAKAALDLYYTHRGERPIVAIVYTHSHADHFGGARGIVSQADVDSGKVQIYAPAGFLEHAVEENVFAGTAMSRRASYMYGNLLPPGEFGNVTAGLGISTSSGRFTLVPPTVTIKETGEKHTIDGIEYEFIMAPGSEAPSEMMWYLPKFKLINTAENSTHNMHNLYTLRGAQTRDARHWPKYLNEVLRTYGDDVEIEIGMHHWPTWGNEQVVEHIEAQRDIYKFMHDQTLHFANQGYTLNELPELVQPPMELTDNWSTHGYYGSLSHNVRAVYNFCLGYFDGNPASLNPLPPAELGRRYVTTMGGADAVLVLGKKAYNEGDYRWAAELVNHLVFAEPENKQARSLQADILTQLGYQSESGPWRNFYLTGAQELRNGIAKLPTPNASSPDIISNMSLELVFGYMGVQLNAKRAAGKEATFVFAFTDIDEHHTIFLKRSVLNHWPQHAAKNADATISLTRKTLDKILSRQSTFQDAISNGEVQVSGDQKKLTDLLTSLDDLNASFWFEIITP